MIYGDKKYKEVEIKYPDINAILQANNLYVYCLNNSIMYSDLTGEKLKKEYVEYKDSKNNYYSYENSIGKHTVDSNTYKTETISDTNDVVKKEDEIEFANDADKGVLLSVLLPSVISNALLMKDTLSGDRLYDNEGRPLHLERGYTVRTNTIIYTTGTRTLVETRYKIFDENGNEVFNDTYISGVQD